MKIKYVDDSKFGKQVFIQGSEGGEVMVVDWKSVPKPLKCVLSALGCGVDVESSSLPDSFYEVKW